MLPPGPPFVVIDMHALRRLSVVESAIADYKRTGVGVILSWAFAFEATKGGGDSFAASLRLLRRHPDAVSVMFTMPTIHSWERRHQTIIEDPIDRTSTGRLREALAAWNAGSLSDGQFQMGFADVAARAAGRVQRADYETMLRTMTANFRKELTPDERRRVQTGLQKGDRAPLRDLLLPTYTRAFFERSYADGPPAGPFKALGPSKARKLASVPSIYALHLLASVVTGLWWAASGGIENTKTLINDGMDIEHAALAAYCRGLVSDDDKASGTYADVKALAAAIWG